MICFGRKLTFLVISSEHMTKKIVCFVHNKMQFASNTNCKRLVFEIVVVNVLMEIFRENKFVIILGPRELIFLYAFYNICQCILTIFFTLSSAIQSTFNTNPLAMCFSFYSRSLQWRRLLNSSLFLIVRARYRFPFLANRS